MAVNLRSFRQRVRHRKTSLRRFLTKLEKNPPRKLDEITVAVEKEVWREIDCLSCANCCKTMSPTYTSKDIKRISAHLNMSSQQFKDKWLHKERGTGDWMNKSTPCQFLDLDTNMCGIYEVRPVDCAGFPHLPKRKMVEYMHVHKQNIEYCPATYRMIEKMMEKMKMPVVSREPGVDSL
jgi:Fe-S-cluster containining protein